MPQKRALRSAARLQKVSPALRDWHDPIPAVLAATADDDPIVGERRRQAIETSRAHRAYLASTCLPESKQAAQGMPNALRWRQYKSVMGA
jgi:hypothetical protein